MGRNYYAHELEYIISAVDGVHPGRNVALGWFRKEVGSEDVVVIAEKRSSNELPDPLLARRINKLWWTRQDYCPLTSKRLNPDGW